MRDGPPLFVILIPWADGPLAGQEFLNTPHRPQRRVFHGVSDVAESSADPADETSDAPAGRGLTDLPQQAP